MMAVGTSLWGKLLEPFLFLKFLKAIPETGWFCDPDRTATLNWAEALYSFCPQRNAYISKYKNSQK